MYSPEEIEKKRLMAQQKRAQLHQPPGQQFAQPGLQNGTGFKRKLESSPLSSREPKQAKQLNTIQPSNFFSKPKIKAACSMITESRFEVDVKYHQQLIDFFKTIPSRAYDQKTKLWNFYIDDYSKVINGIKSQFSGEVEVSPIPRFVLQTFKNLEWQPKTADADLSKIDPVLVAKLMPFQREGINFAIEKNGRCMIADDMGLGKTIQALGIAHYYKDSWPLLIVTPSSVRHQWSEAIYEFLPSVPYQHVFHYSSGKDYIGSEKVTIVSYDLLARNIEAFQKKTFGVVIFDESHTLKSHKTERTKAAQRIAWSARHILLLTGTPALSRPVELHTQISLINRNFMKLQDYGIRYCEGKKGPFGWDFQGACNTRELQLLLKSSHLIRRLKSEVLKQLPDKIRQIVLLDPQLIKAGTKEMQRMAENLKGKLLEGFEKHAELMRYYSESAQQRLTAVGSYVKDLIDKNEKFIIFAHHLCVLDKISEVLDKNRVNYIRIDGKTASDVRKKRVDKFQETEDCLVAVLSITAANSGITLTAASFVVFAELYWNPAELTQAEGRAHRIGQRNCVIIQYLIAKGTVDDVIWPMLQSKASFLQKAGLDQNFSLSQADLIQQPAKTSSTSEDKKQGTLENFGFSQEISSSQDDEFMTPMETFSPRENGKVSQKSSCDENTKKTVSTDNTNVTDDFSKLLDDDDEDFENIDLDDIN